MLKEKYDNRDYMLSWDSQHFLDLKNPYFHVKLEEYSQIKNKKYRNCCTIFWLMASIWYNCWIHFTQEEIEKASDKAIDAWVVDEETWAYFVDAVNFCRKYSKEYYNKKLVSFRIGLESEAFQLWLDNGRAFWIWYQSSKELRLDTEYDWIATKKEYPMWTGHLVYYIAKIDDYYVVNSYYENRKYNQFKFLHFKELLNTLFFFKFWYIIMEEKNIIQNHQYNKDVNDVKEALELGITNDKTILEDILRGNYTLMVRIVLFIMRSRKIKN